MGPSISRNAALNAGHSAPHCVHPACSPCSRRDASGGLEQEDGPISRGSRWHRCCDVSPRQRGVIGRKQTGVPKTTRTSHENEPTDAASHADYRHEWEEYLEQVRDRVAMIVAAASAAGIDLEG